MEASVIIFALLGVFASLLFLCMTPLIGELAGKSAARATKAISKSAKTAARTPKTLLGENSNGVESYRPHELGNLVQLPAPRSLGSHTAPGIPAAPENQRVAAGARASA